VITSLERARMTIGRSIPTALEYCTTSSPRHLREKRSRKVPGLILVAGGAGGHAGTLSPFAFVEKTRQWFDGPIVLRDHRNG